MKLLLCPLLLLAALLLPGTLRAQEQDLVTLDAQNGGIFEIELADSIHLWQGFVKKGFYLMKVNYERPGYVHEFLGTPITKVQYLVYKGRLHSIRIKIEGKVNSDQMLDALFTFYGEGNQENLGPRYNWIGGRVALYYDQNLLTGNCEVIFESKAVQNEFAADRKAAE